MAQFKARELDVLVATTVIEVGVDVPNATIMIVQEADRFGLAQLHQLRGRVGRGAEQSYCLLVSRPKEELTEIAQQRLQALVDTTDGFELAEKDLELRGEGQLLGTRQSGLTDLRFARLVARPAAARAGARGRGRRSSTTTGPLADEVERLLDGRGRRGLTPSPRRCRAIGRWTCPTAASRHACVGHCPNPVSRRNVPSAIVRGLTPAMAARAWRLGIA